MLEQPIDFRLRNRFLRIADADNGEAVIRIQLHLHFLAARRAADGVDQEIGEDQVQAIGIAFDHDRLRRLLETQFLAFGGGLAGDARQGPRRHIDEIDRLTAEPNAARLELVGVEHFVDQEREPASLPFDQRSLFDRGAGHGIDVAENLNGTA